MKGANKMDDKEMRDKIKQIKSLGAPTDKDYEQFNSLANDILNGGKCTKSDIEKLLKSQAIKKILFNCNN